MTDKISKPNKESILILLFAFLWNQGVYCGARLIAGKWEHFDMTTSADLLIPFLPWTVSIYFGCYLFWCVNYFLCAIQNPKDRDRFFCADAIAKGICFLFFLLIPTTNFRPEITGSSIWDFLMRILYRIDAADNLFPSIHCLVSWFCWIGVRRQTNIPCHYRWFSLVVAIAVCISTLTTRQHVIVDVVGGVLLSEICYFISGHRRILLIYSVALHWIFHHVCQFMFFSKRRK